MNMSGSFLPGLGRQPKSTRVEGADIVMQSSRVMVRDLSGYRVNRDLSLSSGAQPDAKEPTRHEGSSEYD